MKEGELYLAQTDKVKKGTFLLALLENAVVPGENIPFCKDSVILDSNESTLADRLIAMGIVRRESKLGKSTLLLTNEDESVKI